MCVAQHNDRISSSIWKMAGNSLGLGSGMAVVDDRMPCSGVRDYLRLLPSFFSKRIF